MWVVEGNFDQSDEETKFKLLKPGRTYPLGRKLKQPLQLVIANPKVSGEHVSFVVGSFPEDKIDDPSFKPSLTLVNHRTKPIMMAIATGERVVVNASSESQLSGGESIALVTGVYVNIHWRPMCCYAPPDAPLSSPAFSALCIKLVSAPGANVTHHLTDVLEANALTATSLLCSASIVCLKWLNEVKRLGTAASADGPSPLEQEFRLPDVSQYKPELGSVSRDLLAQSDLWSENDARKGIFKGWRFLIATASGKVEVGAEIRALVEAGKAEYETYDVSAGMTNWEQAVSRSKRKVDGDGSKGLAVVGDEGLLTLAESDGLLDTLRRLGLRMIGRQELVEAVFLADASRVDSSKGVQDPNAAAASNSSSSGATPSNAPRRKLPPRRATSRETTPAPSAAANSGTVRTVPARASAEPELSTTQAPPQRRKPLIKRTAAKDMILGVDDPSIADIPESQVLQPESKPIKPPSKDLPRARSNALKRRVGTTIELNSSMNTGTASMDVDPEEEPVLKKFKALFEETDPDRQTNVSGNLFSGTTPLSQVSTERVEASLGETRQTESLEVIEEEQDESQRVEKELQITPFEPKTMSAVETQIAKARLASFDSTQASGHRKDQHSKGAAPGKPDTDAAFLRALASTKKGKKREDNFDRDFNNLRISKPEQEKDDEADNYKVLAEFEDEENILGNFMVIMDYELPLRGEASGSKTRMNGVAREEWRGKPDFKKFKKKTAPRSRPAIELFADEFEDFGTGPMYWKHSQTHSREQDTSLPLRPSHAANTDTNERSGSSRRTPQPEAMKAPSRAQTPLKPEPQTPKVTDGRTRGRGRRLPSVHEDDEVAGSKAGASQKDEEPLFLDDANSQPQPQPQLAQRASRSRSAAQAPAPEIDDSPILEDFDSDFHDEGSGENTLLSLPKSTASGAHGNTKVVAQPSPPKKGKKRGAASMADDDGSGGMAFRGFGRKKART